jgi:hypothetical protein
MSNKGITDVVLKELNDILDEALPKETKESLTVWLCKQRQEESDDITLIY